MFGDAKSPNVPRRRSSAPPRSTRSIRSTMPILTRRSGARGSGPAIRHFETSPAVRCRLRPFRRRASSSLLISRSNHSYFSRVPRPVQGSKYSRPHRVCMRRRPGAASDSPPVSAHASFRSRPDRSNRSFAGGLKFADESLRALLAGGIMSPSTPPRT